MTPAEKITALQQQASANDERFDQIAEKAAGRRALADAVAEVGELPNDASLPNISHIVLPDGRVRSGNDVNQVVDASAPAHDVPVIEVPTTDDLGQEQPPHPTASLPDAAAAPDVPDTPDSPESQTRQQSMILARISLHHRLRPRRLLQSQRSKQPKRSLSSWTLRTPRLARHQRSSSTSWPGPQPTNCSMNCEASSRTTAKSRWLHPRSATNTRPHQTSRQR